MAAMVAPEIDPMPPRTTMITASNDFMKLNSSGREAVPAPSWWANSEPATPAKNAANTNADTLYRVVLTPMASAAISFSRTDKNARPCVDSRSRYATNTVSATAVQVQASELYD